MGKRTIKIPKERENRQKKAITSVGALSLLLKAHGKVGFEQI